MLYEDYLIICTESCNTLANESFNKIISNSKINEVLNKENDFDSEVIQINLRINELNKLLYDENDFESINKILNDLKYDEDIKEKIIYDFLIKKLLKKEDNKENNSENKKELVELLNKDAANLKLIELY